MAKIDVSTIENFENLSADELRAYIQNFEYEDNSDAYAKLKESFNKASSDVANYKKLLKEKETEAETTAREKAESEAKAKEETESLRQRLTIIDNEAKYIALGYDKELAHATAEAYAKGDIDTVLKNQETFIKSVKAQAAADDINKQPGLDGGDPNKSPITKKDIMAIKDAEERQKLIAENIELFQ